MTDPVQPVAPPVYVVSRPEGNGFAVASFVLGLVAMLVGVVPVFIGLTLSFVPTVLAIIFGVIGISRANKIRVGRGFAITGLVLGAVVFLLYFVGFGTIW